MSYLNLQGLVKRYGDFTAVNGLDLSVEKGEFVSLLGPSGCGKTTTLQMIAGFVDPTEGRISINGNDVTNLKPNKRDLGIVFQSYALFPHMTVFQNVSFGLEMRSIDKRERTDRVLETLSLVHLGEFADRYPKELSGGQQQRVALARALAIKPDVLLLDEPLSALDAKIREDMQVELRSIQRTVGTTTILVTHDQAEAMALSDRVAVMNSGKLAQVDEPYKAYEHPEDEFVSNFLGKSNVFDGRVKGTNGEFTVIDAAGVEILSTRQNIEVGTPVHACIRPEKIKLVKSGKGTISGSIHTRVFLGNHWVFQVETGTGILTVSTQNIGQQEILEGTSIDLTWAPEEVRLLPVVNDNAA